MAESKAYDCRTREWVLDLSGKPHISGGIDGDGSMIPTVYDPQHFKHKWFINKYREYNQPAIDYARENKEVPRFLLDWLDDRITREDYLYLVSLMAPGFYTQDEICGARQSLTVEAPITQPTYSQHVRQYHRITVDPSAYNLSEEPKH